MRRQLLTFLLAGLSLLAAPSPAKADAMPSDRALTVPQPVSALSPSDIMPSRQTQAIHSVQIGERTLSLKVRYGQIDLIDATGLEASTGMKFRRHQQFMIVDRAHSDERAQLSLRTGQSWVDGRPAAWTDPAGVQTDDRLWLSPEALSALVGLPVSVSGRSVAQMQDVSAKATIETTELTRIGVYELGICHGRLCSLF